MTNLIIFDRDGTLIERIVDGYLTKQEQIVLPQDIYYLKNLMEFDVEVAIVTNQACIGKKLIDIQDFYALHDLVLNRIFGSFDRKVKTFFCPHLEGTCSCRKPSGELIKRAILHFGADVETTTFVGDSPSDEQAAWNAGVEFVGVCWDSKSCLTNCHHTLKNLVDYLISRGLKGDLNEGNV